MQLDVYTVLRMGRLVIDDMQKLYGFQMSQYRRKLHNFERGFDRAFVVAYNTLRILAKDETPVEAMANQVTDGASTARAPRAPRVPRMPCVPCVPRAPCVPCVPRAPRAPCVPCVLRVPRVPCASERACCTSELPRTIALGGCRPPSRIQPIPLHPFRSGGWWSPSFPTR